LTQSGPSNHPVQADHSALRYQVRITPTTMKAGSTSSAIGADSWEVRGYDLKSLIAQVYDIDVRRIDLPDEVAGDTRYDMTLEQPAEVSAETMHQMLQDAIEKKFGVTIAPENRPMQVYVLSAPNGAGTAMHLHSAAAPGLKTLVAGAEDAGDDGGRITYVEKDCSGVASGGIAVSGSTIADFRRTLEGDLDRVLIDETHLDGSFDFKIGNYGNQQELFHRLADQLGIVVTPAERNVTVLAVRPVAAQGALL
jgi:uncharacterized protein (TIGR03435 family)